MATTETILEATIKAGVEHFGGFPSGTMIAFAGKSVPDGWLLCNGALVSRKTYSRLFAAIGTAWGAGDGRTTFKLPDADGRVMQGVTDASKVGQLLEAGLPNITGQIQFHGRQTDNQGGTVLNILSGCFYGTEKQSRYGHAPNDSYSGSWGTANLSGDLSNACFGKSNSVQPPALQTLIIIKV